MTQQQMCRVCAVYEAGESYADAQGIGNSNPVNKQSQYAELTGLGKRQIVQRVAPALAATNIVNDGAWIWPSINSCSYQTAAILSSTLALGQSRIVPEYSFLDCRGLGSLDGQPTADVGPLLREGDQSSPLWRPPRGAPALQFACESKVLPWQAPRP